MFPLKDDNPTRTAPVVTIALIAVNALVFFHQLSLPPGSAERFVYQFGSIPAVITGLGRLPADLAAVPPLASVLTSMFLHGGWMHLVGNMWFLWIFGNNIEEATGRFRFVLFYLACGLAAGAAHILANPDSAIPAIGASGAIGGVLGAYIMIYPRARVWTLIFLFVFIRVLYLPAGVILGYWFVLQLLGGTTTAGGAGGVAFWAHVGGFVAGAALVGVFKKKGVRFFNPPHRGEDGRLSPRAWP